LPTSAIPAGPKKIAMTFDEINPVKILKITLKLFREVILKRDVLSISFLKINEIYF